MYLRVQPEVPAIRPAFASAMDSSARTVVVPTATMRPPCSRAARIAAAAASLTSNHSSSIACSRGSSAVMGRNVPGPT